MSTYGKKALVWWNYLERDGMRFNHTPMDTQLLILEKWYPIGMKINMWVNFRKDWDNRSVYTIVRYKKNLSHYMVEVVTTNNEVTSVLMGLHPTNIKPTDEWMKLHKRDVKIDRLLGNN